jgi:Protein of unknown function (DUF3089)
MTPRRKKLLLGAAAVVIACACLVAGCFGKLMMAALAPSAPFDAAAVPPPPSYTDAAAWSALPDRADAADAEIATLHTGDQKSAPADVFYIHPTSYVGSQWNGRLDDSDVNTATDKGATLIQASAFNECCAVYAPRYRQANLTAFTNPSDEGAKALDLAAGDVVAAFKYYLDNYNKGRPFIIAAHSQGAAHGFRLLKDVIAGTALRDRLVVAYLIGGPLTEETLAAVPGLRACDSPGETGCVVGFNARSPSYTGGLDFVEYPAPPPGSPPRRRLCVNPLTWRHDEAAADRALNRGAVFFDASGAPPTPQPGFAGAHCRGGFLRVEMQGTPPRDFMSRLLDHAIGDGNYHPIEYGLFFVNLRDNARERIAAFTKGAAPVPGDTP